MAIDKASPDEIKGLLLQKEEQPVAAKGLKQVEKEALAELLNVSLGSSSAILSPMFSRQTAIVPGKQLIVHRDEMLAGTLSPLFVALGDYSGGITGMQIFSISKSDVQELAQLLGADKDDMEKQYQVLQDVIQQMFESASKAMSMILEKEVSHSLSGMDFVETRHDFPVAKFTAEEWFVESQFQLEIDGQKAVDFQLSLPVQTVKEMTTILTGEIDEEYPEEKQEMEFKTNMTNKTGEANETPVIQSVQFSNFDETASTQSEPNNLNMLLDIPLLVTVELGRTKRMVKEILNVSHGSIIELDKLAGEPVDILINNKLIAVGEVVVIDENFGVRVTDILSTADRISKLR